MYAFVAVVVVMLEGHELTDETKMHPIPSYAVCEAVKASWLKATAQQSPPRRVVKAECESIAPPAASWGPPR